MRHIYLTMMLVLFTASHAVAAASLTPAFSTFSGAGGAVNAGKQGTNVMLVDGAVFSKPAGKPTMTIPTSAADAKNYPSLAAALATGRKVIVSTAISISAPVALQNGQELEILGGASITAASDFSGADMIVLDGGGGGVSAMQKVYIHGGGTISCNGNAQRGINVKLARQSRIEGLALDGCTMNGIAVGTTAGIGNSSYEITIADNTVRNDGDGTNDADSVGILYDNATDSVATNNVPIGYRTGMRMNSGNVMFMNNHPWTLGSYGPMKYAFYVNGTGARLIGNYADSPTPLSDGTVGDVYGYYLNSYNTYMSGNSGFLAYGTSVDNTAYGIHVAKTDGLYGTISGGHFYTENSSVKWVRVLSGYYGYNTEITPHPTTNGNVYTSSGGARISAPDIFTDDTGVVALVPSDGASNRTSALTVNSRARFGYDGPTGTVVVSDNGATKAVSVQSGGVEGLRVSSSTAEIFRYGGNYNNGHLTIGPYHIWAESATGKLRVKNGVPVSDSDGTIVGQQ